MSVPRRRSSSHYSLNDLGVSCRDLSVMTMPEADGRSLSPLPSQERLETCGPWAVPAVQTRWAGARSNRRPFRLSELTSTLIAALVPRSDGGRCTPTVAGGCRRCRQPRARSRRRGPAAPLGTPGGHTGVTLTASGPFGGPFLLDHGVPRVRSGSPGRSSGHPAGRRLACSTLLLGPVCRIVSTFYPLCVDFLYMGDMAERRYQCP
jgi:hypothetical protein